MPDTIDRALAYDPVTRQCDRVFDGVDCVLDATPVTPLLMAVGLDRRARADDALPDTVQDIALPHRLDIRRGWCGDALDPLARLVGSRMWLLRRRKQDEATRRLAESALKEAVEPLAEARGWPVTITVRWVRWGLLGWQVKAGRAVVAINQAVA